MEKVSHSPWNPVTTQDIEYDFDALTAMGGRGELRPSIRTFGGDRETYEFTDPANHLIVNKDIWAI